jgi:hypothetical protein
LGSNVTTNEAVNLLLAQNLSSEEANENFTFYAPEPGQIDSNGAASFSFTPDKPGQYAFVLVASDNGDAVSVTQGNISLSGDAQVLGVDGAPVQKAQATASAQNDPVDPGENITFDVDSNLNANEVNHTIVVFDEDELRDQSSTVTIHDAIDSDLTADNVTVDHSVKSVDGVARVENGAQVMGVDLSDGTVSRSVTIASIIDFLANETNQTAPDSTATGDVVLNASTTSVVDKPSSTTVDVGTSENWTNGTYTYVYIASTNNTSEFSTTKGTVTVGKPKDVQLSISVNRTNVKVGQAFELTVIRSDDGTPVSGATVTINGETITTSNGKAVVHPSTAGDHTITATKPSTSTENYLKATRTLSVAAAATDDDDDDGGGGGGQGGGSDGGSADPIPTNDGATVNFRDTVGGKPLSVQVPNVASEQAAVTGMEITTTFSERRFRVEFTKPQADPAGGAPALDAKSGQAVNYFTAVAIGLSDDRIDSVTFTFTLADSLIPDDRSKDDVRLYRYVDGEWVTLETTHVGGNEYRAESPGFTTYAIGFAPAQQATDTATPTPTATATATATDEPTTDVTSPGTMTEPPDEGGFNTLIIGIVILLLLLLGVGVYYDQQR